VKLVIGDVEQFLIGDQIAWTDAESHATTREVIEKSHPLSDMERMMKRQADHRRAEANALRMRGRFGERHFRRGHGFPTTRVVFADEELVEIELIGIANKRDIAVERQRRIFRRIMQRHHENGKFHSPSLTG
jgi:hypothetical protein